MIDPKQLLDDLQSLLAKTIEPDLRERSELPEIAAALTAEFETAKAAERTALNYTDWRSDYITQIGVGWVLSCVFIRFLEDNDLIAPPKLSGPTGAGAGAGAISGQQSADSKKKLNAESASELNADRSRAESASELNADSFGNANRLRRARDEYDLYIKANPTHSFRQYILSVVDQLAKLPGVGDIFGDKNVIHQQPDWLSNDAAKALYNFWQGIVPETGKLIHDFTQGGGGAVGNQRSADSKKRLNAESVSELTADGFFDTRFLGDLYQDLSEAARKKYALLQTPDFVEEFILDRTLKPALDEFGLTPGKLTAESASELTADRFFKLIDPACGSGHFLLGAFPRILRRWQQKEPGTKVDVLVQRTLYSIHGVDINPFAIAIARFRLLLAACRACGIERLKNAIDFDLSNLACGDSLYHGRQKQGLLADWTDESHYFQTEDADNLKRILQEGTFHAVVANPPYITPKDKAANKAYRELYPESCHRQYSLSVPFMDRIFRLACSGSGGSLTQRREDAKETDALQNENRKLNTENSRAAGYTGQITANSFMKREFGKKLIESFFPVVDLTHMIDTSGAYIPGHGTPTTILFGRNRKPVSKTIRTVMGIRGEPSTPEDAAKGKVWTAILEQIDQPGSESEFVSSDDSERALFSKHPWSIGGGGASELKEKLEGDAITPLSGLIECVGFVCMTRADDLYLAERNTWARLGVPLANSVLDVVGESVRDWQLANMLQALFPYDQNLEPTIESTATFRACWPHRTGLWLRREQGGNHKDLGMTWFEWSRFLRDRYTAPYIITYAEIATHNHFVLDRGGKVFKQTAPVIKLPADATEDDHLALLGLLNSSTACFWMKQVCFPKGGDHVGQEGARVRRSLWDERYAFNATNIEKLPLPESKPLNTARALDQLSQQLQQFAPDQILTPRRQGAKETSDPELCVSAPLRETLQTARNKYERILGLMIFTQEELDWECYQHYGLTDEDLTYSGEPVPLSFGERSFEILLGRRMARDPDLTTTWFTRHNATALTAPPESWPDDYQALYHRRHDIQQSNQAIGLIEQPEYKRRWNTEPWDSQVQRALKSWLLDRLESYFDFDGRMEAVSSQPSADSEEKLKAESDSELKAECSIADRSTPPLADIQLVSVAKLADVAAKDSQFMEVAVVYRDREDFDIVKLVDELVSEEHVPALPILRYKPSGLDKRAAWEETWELQRAEDAIEARVREQLDGLLKLGGKQQDKEGVFRKDLPDDSPLLTFFGTPTSRLGASPGSATEETVASAKTAQVVNDGLTQSRQDAKDDGADTENRKLKTENLSEATDSFLTVDEIVRRAVKQEMGPIPVPPKYASKDMISTGGAKYWKLRGKLDVPKERWVSFPHTEGEDQTLMIAWAGYDHLQLLRAIAAYFADVQQRGGSDDPRLVPLLAAMDQQIPWVKQWHNDLDPEFNMRLGDYFADFIDDEARNLGMTIEDVRKWDPPKAVKKKRAKKATKKKATKKKVEEA